MDTGIVSGNALNVPQESKIKTRSKFNLSYHNFQTMRFGELTPHFVQECVPDDKDITVRCKHDVRAYTLGAPLMSNIDIKKDYFAVPMEAILPNTWPLIYTNPTIGDDVPDDANSVLNSNQFLNFVSWYLSSLFDVYTDTGESISSRVTALLKFLFFGELVFSTGSLMNSLGYKFWPCFEASSSNVRYNFDEIFNLCINALERHTLVITFYLDDSTTETKTYTVSAGLNSYSLRQMVEDMRDNPLFSVSVFMGDFDLPSFTYEILVPTGENSIFINFARLAAYQIACAHFYSNDSVDYIYSAELWRDMMWSLFYSAASYDGSTGVSSDLLSFNYNGRRVSYDCVSGSVLYFMFNVISDVPRFPIAYWHHLLSFKHSLRYMDYFVGSKTRPLAVGDVNVAVNNGVANMLDITQKRWVMKYLNAVNKFGRKFSNYIEGLTGERPAPDYHNPFWIGHTTDTIYGQEVENTGEAQLSTDVQVPITSNLRGNADKFAFQFDADRPCIVIGISYFDVPRAYFAGIERLVMHKDRFDMFNPYMQFLGDQKVYGSELFSVRVSDSVFGYQGRYEEYKQRYNVASGGFVDQLVGWTFLNDFDLMRYGRWIGKVSPSFIRSKSYELDRLFKSLSGYSLGTYFHFIVDTYNDVSASRPMAFNPSID